jgi:molybdenum cofactor biosynthesis enzyme MoaA
VEISIDAATKETYEVIRRGGTWETLLLNLEFISTLGLHDIRTSFVVQDTNYLEMNDFYNLMTDIFNRKANIYFSKITNWGTYTEEEFKIKQIWNELHPEFNLFLLQLSKINKKHMCIHNMYDIIEKYLPKKLVSLI